MMVATLLSRVLGLVRDIVITHQFGTSGDINDYYSAFRIPDTLYLIIVGGALGSALIPVFSRFLGQDRPEDAWRLASAVINFSLLILLITAALTFIFAPTIVSTILVPDYSPKDKQLTTDLTRLLLIQPIFLGMGGIAMALLNGTQHFAMPAIAPVIYNLFLIAGAWFLAPTMGVYGIIVGVLIGAFFYLVVQIPVLIKLGLRYRIGLDKDAPGLGQVLKVLGPRLLGQAAYQINFIAMTNFASIDLAYSSALTQTYNLLMLPFGIFALSTATVTFPAMARQFGANDLSGFKRTFSNGVRQILFFCLPASIGLIILNRPIIRTLYESGKFNAASVNLEATPVLFFGLALISYGLVEIATRAFYAMHDTRTPVAVSITIIVINIVLGKLLIGPLGVAGLALGLGISTTIEMILLLAFLRPRLHGLVERDAIEAALKMALAGGAMALGLLIAVLVLNVPLNNSGKLEVVVLTLFLIGFGATIYGAFAYLLKLEELHNTLMRIRARFGR